MTRYFINIEVIFAVFILTIKVQTAFGCSCVGKGQQTTEAELNSVDLVVKGRIISVADYFYYDTAEYSLTGLKFDSKKNPYLKRTYKSFRLIVDKKYKASSNLPDTIEIITGQGGGDCGYEFTVGKDYIVYAMGWKEKQVIVLQKRKKVKRKIVNTNFRDKFETDICSLTQLSNEKEINNLEKLTL